MKQRNPGWKTPPQQVIPNKKKHRDFEDDTMEWLMADAKEAELEPDTLLDEDDPLSGYGR